MRETLFDVLAPRIAGTVFLDAYAGSGAVGIEALSRGAARAIFIENHRGAVEVIHQNLKSLGLEGRAEVVRGKAVAVLARREAGIVFLDPPYDLPAEYDAALRALGERPSALVIAQHRPVVVVEFLDHLEGPAAVEHVATHHFFRQPIGDRAVARRAQLVAGLADQQIGVAHQLVEGIQMAAGPLNPLQRLGERAHRLDGVVADPVGSSAR